MGTPAFAPWAGTHFSCIDGRHDDAILGTPGGDMGVFVSAAAVYIASAPRPQPEPAAVAPRDAHKRYAL